MTRPTDDELEVMAVKLEQIGWRPSGERDEAAAMLRALSAERDALKAELAEAVRLVRALQKAAHNDRYIGQDYPVKAVDAFLARHQKETGV